MHTGNHVSQRRSSSKGAEAKGTFLKEGNLYLRLRNAMNKGKEWRKHIWGQKAQARAVYVSQECLKAQERLTRLQSLAGRPGIWSTDRPWEGTETFKHRSPHQFHLSDRTLYSSFESGSEETHCTGGKARWEGCMIMWETDNESPSRAGGVECGVIGERVKRQNLQAQGN